MDEMNQILSNKKGIIAQRSNLFHINFIEQQKSKKCLMKTTKTFFKIHNSFFAELSLTFKTNFTKEEC